MCAPIATFRSVGLQARGASAGHAAEGAGQEGRSRVVPLQPDRSESASSDQQISRNLALACLPALSGLNPQASALGSVAVRSSPASLRPLDHTEIAAVGLDAWMESENQRIKRLLEARTPQRTPHPVQRFTRFATAEASFQSDFMNLEGRVP